jgi:hypothetical protein
MGTVARCAFAVTALMLATSANAAHCGHGKIYRVHMGICVSEHSRLARMAMIRTHHPRLARLEPPGRTPVAVKAPRTVERHHPSPETDSAVLGFLGLPDPFAHSTLSQRPNYWRDRAALPVRAP